VVRVDRNGAEVGRLGKERSDLGDPVLSPDGSRLAVTLKGNELWVEDLVRGTSTRLVEEDGAILEPRWTADGRALHYSVVGKSSRFRRIRADPGAAPETVLEEVHLASVAPDSGGILFQKASFALKTGQGLHWVALDAAGPVGEPKRVLDGIGTFGRLSPDGKMLAYARAVERRHDAFLTTFPALDQTIQLSSNGGDAPRWSPDGRSVFYNSGSELIQVDVDLDAQGRLSASPEHELFDAAKASFHLDGWTASPDGKGFLFVKSLEPDSRSEIVVVRNGLQRAISEAR
jgi:dipeptidyl aminopeptidase/acylaminoacyl peptidase